MTSEVFKPCRIFSYFNPHEREARDPVDLALKEESKYFNPHEREARDHGVNAIRALIKAF